MTFAELKNKTDEYLGPIILDSIQNFRTRMIARRIIFGLFFAMFAGLILFPDVIEEYLSLYIFRAATFLLLIVWIKYEMLEWMYLSFYFRRNKYIEFELAKLISETEFNDLTKSFLENDIVQSAFNRCGFEIQKLNNFYEERDDLVQDIEIEINKADVNGPVRFLDYAEAIFKTDRNLERFLKMQGLNKESFMGALDWILDNLYLYKKQFMWWSKDHLVRIPSIGKNWSYGKTYLLEKYAKIIYAHETYASVETKWEIYAKYVFLIEQALQKKSGANALLLVPTNEIGMTIVASFAKMIVNGRAHTELEDKRIYVLDVGAIIDSTGNKIDFENEISNLIIESQNAGNVVISIPNFAEAIISAHEIGSDLTTILNSLISSSEINIIAISGKENYHNTLEMNKSLLNSFEKIEINDISTQDGLSVLKDVANQFEIRENVYILYTALEKISESADRYFSDSVFSDKVFDLLQEVVIFAKQNREKVITPELVSKLIQNKTGIPVGEINEKEKQVLMNLESELHKRVIGQNEAILAVAETLRRSRVGIQNPNRPMGSLLFMGPTGVGKTETTKALADIFFRDENKIIRLDMSEYNSSLSVQKLIGDNFGVGYLAKTLRDNPYGILLLDEFEKAHEDVHNLFLQIIDEGNFTDSRGEKIDARNTIIIATSNAESDLIYNLNQKGEDLQKNKNLIIDAVIQNNIFKPELLNRFDGIIFFHPLNTKEFEEIAKLMIKKLNERLSDKGILIVENQNVLEFLVKNAINSQFGAREMNRLIQDKIESLVAKALISGEISRGEKIELLLSGESLIINKHPQA